MISLALLQIFVAAVIIMWLSESVKDKKAAFGRIEMIFCTFVIIRLISVAFSSFPASSSQSLYKEALYFLSFLPFSFYFRVLNNKDRKFIAGTFINISAVIAVIGIVRFALNYEHRAASVVSGYATFSAYMIVATAMLIIENYNEYSLEEKLLYILKGALILSGLVLAMSRADIGVAVLILLAALAFRKIKIVPILAMTAVAAAISFFAFTQNSKEIHSRIANPTTLSDRDIIWSGAYSLSAKHPMLGFGPRTFKDIFPYRAKLQDTEVGGWHNEYISIYIESGIFALLIILYFAGYLTFHGIQAIIQSRDANAMLWGLLFALLAMFGSAFMSSGFVSSPILSIVFNFLAGMFISETGKSQA
jgi:O-antigen ligase